MKQQSWQRAFTIPELIIVVGIIGLLTALALVSLRPKENMAEAHDAVRRKDMRVMSNALYQYQIDNDTFPQVALHPTLDSQQRYVCSLTTPSFFYCNFDTPERLPLGSLIPVYLAELPRDPQQPGDPANCGLDLATVAEDCSTGYRLWLDSDGRIHADAPLSDDSENLETSR